MQRKEFYLPSVFQICSSFWRHRTIGREAQRASLECHHAFGRQLSTLGKEEEGGKRAGIGSKQTSKDGEMRMEQVGLRWRQKKGKRLKRIGRYKYKKEEMKERQREEEGRQGDRGEKKHDNIYRTRCQGNIYINMKVFLIN